MIVDIRRNAARVATWRGLQRLGAVTLTPGAAILPFSEHLLEQLQWIAEDVVQRGGDAYVLPVTELPEADEDRIRRRMRAAPRYEYARLKQLATSLRRRTVEPQRLEREIAALERGFVRAVERDHFDSAGRESAQRAIRQARKRKEA